VKNELQNERLVLCVVDADLVDVPEVDAEKSLNFVVFDTLAVLITLL